MNNIGTDNYANREAWVKKVLTEIPAGETILDAGAGPMNFKPLCGHLAYKSQDLNNVYKNDKIDIVSNITAIPVPDTSFDNVLCTEVLEHVPDPVVALREIARILKPGGRLILTAPFACFKHEEPYFFNCGFAKRWYEYHLPPLGFNIVSMEENGNYYKFISQELRRISDYNPYCKDKIIGTVETIEACTVNKDLENMACYGVHVLARKG